MFEQQEFEKSIIIKHGGEDITEYCLVNNTGYIFTLNNRRFDARHFRNIYGFDVNYFSIFKADNIKKKINRKTLKIIDKLQEELNTIIKY